MATPRTVIGRALRMIGAVESGASPTSTELDDSLTAYNGMVAALRGNGIGPRLFPKQYTSAATLENGRRAVCVLAAGITLTAPLNPADGDRFGAADGGGNFATNNLTVNPNSRLIEGATANIVLSTNFATRSWFFREDTGNWVKEADLTIDQTIDFPDDIVENLIPMLAVRLQPEFTGAVPVTDAVKALAAEGVDAIWNRYGRKGRNVARPPSGVQSPMATQRVGV